MLRVTEEGGKTQVLGCKDVQNISSFSCFYEGSCDTGLGLPAGNYFQ